MKWAIPATLGTVLALGAIGPTIASDPPGGSDDRAATPKVRDLHWLAGHWRGTVDGGTWEASYTSPEGGVVVSANKELRDGKVVMIEFERFAKVAGKLTLIPYPFGKESEVAFTAERVDREARRAVFANPDHDFPQRITYHQTDPDRLHVKITGSRRGAPVTITLDLRRVRGADDD
jgi:hypothetical protein